MLLLYMNSRKNKNLCKYQRFYLLVVYTVRVVFITFLSDYALLVRTLSVMS